MLQSYQAIYDHGRLETVHLLLPDPFGSHSAPAC